LLLAYGVRVALALAKKPIVPILSPPLFPHPARNYLASMLAADIRSVAPKRALDAGAGVLRTLQLFPPGSYTGVGLYLEELENGLNHQSAFVAQFGAPTLIQADLNGDCRFLGEYDLVVCTGTASYFNNPPDTICRLADLVLTRGAMLIEIPMNLFRPIKASRLVAMFQRIDAVPYNCHGIPEDVPSCIIHLDLQLTGRKAREGAAKSFGEEVYSDQDIETLKALTVLEMESPTVFAQSQSVYLRCINRIG